MYLFSLAIFLHKFKNKLIQTNPKTIFILYLYKIFKYLDILNMIRHFID
jgi:hypothetical protein